MNKKYLILGLVALAGGYYWYTTRKSKTTTAAEAPTGGARPAETGSAVAATPDVLPEVPSPLSQYEGKNIFHGNPADGSYIDGMVFKVVDGKKTGYDSSSDDLDWNKAVANGAVAEAVTLDVLNSIPDFSKTSSFASFANASGDFFAVRSSNW